tara:strand:- start:3609 stop:3722 length:114 start_codon:yes stop_codon:yes gene_type:complete
MALIANIRNGVCLMCERPLDDHDGVMAGRPVCRKQAA